jgi:predicted DNA-binding ribbon-helix-helix protein
MQSVVRKRSVLIDRHKTSVSLEDPFWSSLQEIARQRNVGVSHLLEQINRQRAPANLSSALRVFVLHHYLALARGGLQTEAGGQPLVRPVSDGTAALLAAEDRLHVSGATSFAAATRASGPPHIR